MPKRKSEAIVKVPNQAARAPGFLMGDVTPYRPDRPLRIPEQSQATIATAADLGGLIRKVRSERKLSQQALADLAGVGRRFLSELEKGKETSEIGLALRVTSSLGIDLTARTR